MDWQAVLLGVIAAVAVFGTGLLDWKSPRTRRRQALQAEVALLRDLPPESAQRAALAAHVDRGVADYLRPPQTWLERKLAIPAPNNPKAKRELMVFGAAMIASLVTVGVAQANDSGVAFVVAIPLTVFAYVMARRVGRSFG